MSSKINIIPKPNEIKHLSGQCEISTEDTISYSSKCKISGQYLEEFTGLKKSKEGRIKLKISQSIKCKEGYILEITPECITISGANDRGIFYGVQSLRQLMNTSIEIDKITDNITLPCIKITDEPRFFYRGFMLDVSRHFFDVDTLKRQIDLMALHKLNKFHWHLSDDQGFRVELKKYPLLTKVGGYRKKTLVKGYMLPWGRKYDNTKYGGYYTEDDIEEIVSYARSRHIDIIPEIDMPGHMQAILAAYPEFSCDGKDIETACEPCISKQVLCIGKDEAIDFAVDILLEIGKMFPYKHIHIGGDEVKPNKWKNCPDCKKKMKDNNIDKADKLQDYFTDIIAKKLKDKGFKIIGWDGVLSDNMDKNIISQHWLPKNKEKSIEYINKGVKTIFSPLSKYYLDYTYELIPLRQSYEYEPFKEDIDKKNLDNVLGVEGALWTEFVDSQGRIDWQTYPLLTAISEAGWTFAYEKDYKGFLQRLKVIEKRYEILGVNHCTDELYLYDKSPKFSKLFFKSDHIANIAYYKHNEDNREYDN